MEDINSSSIISSVPEITTVIPPPVTTVIPTPVTNVIPPPVATETTPQPEGSTIPPPTFGSSPPAFVSLPIPANPFAPEMETDMAFERGPMGRRHGFSALEDWTLGDSGPARLYRSTTTGPLYSTRMSGTSVSAIPTPNLSSFQIPMSRTTTPNEETEAFRQPIPDVHGFDAPRQPASAGSQPGTQGMGENPSMETQRRIFQNNQGTASASAPASSNDLLAQLLASLQPAPQQTIPQQSGADVLLAQLVDRLKQNVPPPTPPPQNNNQELLRLLQQLAGGETRREATMPVSVVSSKFCDWVSRYPMPDKQKVPSIVGTYDGTRDPDDHMALYEQAIMTEKWVDPVACNMFPGTLQGYARDWFAGLPERSIRDFADLKAKFVYQFFQQKKQRRTHLEAHLIRQKEGEALRDFILRYTQECQKIPGLPESQQISGFTFSLLPGQLQEKLAKRTPATFKEATDRAYDFLRSRETVSLARGVAGKKDKSWNNGSGSGRQDQQREERRDNRRDDRSHRRFNPYDKTASEPFLNKTPKEILQTERVGSTFKPPPQMAHRSGKKNMNKYCEFHEDHGHDTNACRELKGEIRRALDEGKLEHLVPAARQQVTRTPAQKTYAWQKRGEDIERPGPADGHILMIEDQTYMD